MGQTIGPQACASDGAASVDHPLPAPTGALVEDAPSAVRLLENATATAEDIDTAMKGGCNFPMGPLALLDLVGLAGFVSFMVTAAWLRSREVEEILQRLGG